MKLSFSISSKPSSRPNSAKTQSFHNQQAADGGSAGDGEPQPQFVTVFDPSKTLASDASARRVIPPIPNADLLRPLKKMKNLIPPSSSDDPTPSSETHFVLDTSAADPAAAAIPFGLTLRSNGGAPGRMPEGDDIRRSEPAEDVILRRFHEDITSLPDDRGFDEFADIPVEGFGAALLAGYGWSEGKGIGRNNKGDTEVVQYEARVGNAGLGYVPSPDDPKASKRKGHRAAHEERKPDSRQVDPEKIVRVISGRHAGLKGKIVKRSGSSEIFLKLLQSGEEVWVGEDMVAELGSEEEERCLKKLRELEISDRVERKEERRSRDSRREEKRGRESRKEENRGRNNRKEENRGRAEEAKPTEKSSSGSGGGVGWLTSHIRVRIISRDFQGGKLYRQKGEVVDVVGPRMCDITMDGSGELVQGVEQEILETVLPKRGGSVLVLYGKHKGVFGNLVERDMEEETGVVRDVDSYAMINVRLDQIAEYVGDPSYLGY